MADAVRVAVAVLERGDGRVLVAHRDADRHQGGGLEFPGGKLAAGETPWAGLARELEEELDVVPTATEPLIRVRHDYGDRAVVLDTHRVTGWRGEPRGVEGQRIEWRAPAALDPAEFPAANRPIVAALQLPGLGPVLEVDAAAAADPAAVEAGLREMLGQTARLLRLRVREPGLADWQRLLAALSRTIPEYPGSRLLSNAPGAQAGHLPGRVGLHLSAAEMAACRGRPVGPDRLLSCACHDAAELARAEALGADLAYLGPVAATATHPGVEPLGWSRFEALAAGTTLPVYAIGGLAPGDLARARQAGAVGVAGIRGFLPRVLTPR